MAPPRPDGGEQPVPASHERDFHAWAVEQAALLWASPPRARSRRGGRPFEMTAAKRRLAQAAMRRRETRVGALYAEPGITHQTLYRHVDPQGRLRPDGERLLRRRRAGRGQRPPADARRTEVGERHA